MQHGHSTKSHRIMNQEVADRLLETLRPTRHLLTRSLAEIPIGGPEYRQIDRVVHQIDGLTEILIGDEPISTGMPIRQGGKRRKKPMSPL